MDNGRATYDRRSRRAPVLLAATIEIAGVPIPVKLRNISEDGALIEGDRLPAEGTTTRFQRNDLRLESRVVWVHGRFAGVAFARVLNRDELLRHVSKAKPQSAARADFRRPGFTTRPLSDGERDMLENWMTAPTIAPLGE